MSEEEILNGLPPHITSEFFLWLWYVSEVDRGQMSFGGDAGDIQFWVDDRLSFRAPGEDKAAAVLTGDRPTDAPEARAALVGGKVLRDLRLHIQREEREYTVTLKGGPRLSISGAKLPGQVKTGDVAEILYDRMFLYEELHFFVSQLFRRFAEDRTSANWSRETLPGLRRWAQNVKAGELDEDGPSA